MNFDAFFEAHIAPIYTKSRDEARYLKAKNYIWQFLWMFLLCVALTVGVHWYAGEPFFTLLTGVSFLFLSCVYYVQGYPYPAFEKPGFFTYFFILLFAAGGAGVLWMAPRSSEPRIVTIMGCVFICVSVVITLAQSPHRAALTRPYEELKSEVTDLFFRQLFPEWRLTEERLFSIENIEQMQFIPGPFHEAEYGIALQNHTTGASLQQIKLMKVTKDNKGRSSRSTVFEGFLMHLPQRFVQAAPVILREHRGFGIQDIFVEETTRIEMENPLFEEQCDVVSTNELEARRIITPVFMERILPLMSGDPRLCGIYFGTGFTSTAFRTRHTLLDAEFADREHARQGLERDYRILNQVFQSRMVQ